MYGATIAVLLPLENHDVIVKRCVHALLISIQLRITAGDSALMKNKRYM